MLLQKICVRMGGVIVTTCESGEKLEEKGGVSRVCDYGWLGYSVFVKNEGESWVVLRVFKGSFLVALRFLFYLH